MADTTPLILMGAGSGATEVLELIRDINQNGGAFDVIGILDDDETKHDREIDGATVIGPLDRANENAEAKLVFNIGSYKDRLARYKILQRLGLDVGRFQSLVHPSAKVYASAEIGFGAIVHFGAVIGPETRLQGLNVVHWNASVGARNDLGVGSIVSPNATTNADVRLGAYCFLGGASVVLDGIAVGPAALIASGDAVHRDVPPGVFQMGLPPRVLGRQDVPKELMNEWAASAA